MKTHNMLSTLFFSVLVVASCKQRKTENTERVEGQVPAAMEQPKITLEKLEASPAYADAVLQLEMPNRMTIAEGGEVDFAFLVNNYELGAQTSGPNTERLANSGKGQHIHFILDNQPYSAHYKAEFSKEIPNGVHHLVAFLSRSYHESVKNKNSVVARKLVIGPNATDTLGLDMEAPTLIYSRPKGTYSGKDTENLLLDFFVLNTTLSENGNKVKATINDQVFMITEWAPHVVKGLPMGKVTITLELLDLYGNPIPGAFNKVTRIVTLTE